MYGFVRESWRASLAFVSVVVLTGAFSIVDADHHSKKSLPEPTLTFSTIYTVGVLNGPEEEIFGRYQTIALATEGTLYVGDKDAREIRIFNEEGKYVKTIGREGQGPGEFMNLYSLALSPEEDSLYVYDGAADRITVYSTDRFKLERDFTVNVLNKGASFKMYLIDSGLFMFVGYGGRGDELVHWGTMQGRHVHSFGQLLQVDDPKYDTEFMRYQLNQGVATEAEGGDIIVSLIAPYRMARFSAKGELRWQIEDDILPKPWDGYITYTSENYRVGLYPQIASIDWLGNSKFLVTHYDIEKEEGFYDIREASDGSLLARHPFPVTQFISSLLSREETSGLAAIKSIDPFPQFSVVHWKLETNPQN